MDCPGCYQHVTTGLEIVIDPLKTEWSHCPYCLEVLTPGFSAPEPEARALAEERTAKRRIVRERFLARLQEKSNDGTPRCPMCERRLDQTDVELLRNGEYLRCHLCCHDLATIAYREDAYHPQRWLPVIGALADLQGVEQWTQSIYIGAIAKACQAAFANMPTHEAKPYGLLVDILCGGHWMNSGPEDWDSNIAVEQYRRTAGAGLLLL